MKNLRDRFKQSGDRSLDNKLADFYDLNKIEDARELDKEEFNHIAQIAHKYIKLAKVQVSALGPKISQLKASSAYKYFKELNFGIKITLSTVLVVGALGLIIFSRETSTDNTGSQVQGDSATQEVVEPEFAVYKPGTRNGNEASPKRIAYDPGKQVASYSTEIEGKPFVYSQQLITTEDATRENFLLTVAQSFGLNRELQTKTGPVFIGSNENEKVMTAVTLRGKNLIFLRSEGIVNEIKIVEFLDELEE